jgi:C4-type Zn-finger protein
MDREPAPEGFEGRCLYCGRRLTGLKTSYHLPYMGEVPEIARFCSEECARAYEATTEEELEEFEEIERAGAT